MTQGLLCHGMGTVFVFDLMDTVVRDPFYEEIPRYLGMPFPELLAHKHPSSWLDFERGFIDETIFLQNFYRDGRSLADPAGLKAAFMDYYAFLPGMEALLGDLKRSGQSLWVLSNYCPWFEDIRRKLALDRFFDGYVISYQSGFRKPEPEAFRALMAQYGGEDGDFILIDDRAINIQGAEQVGWQGILFTDADQVRKACLQP